MSQVLGSKPKITTKMERLIHAWVAEKGLSRAHNDGDAQAVERKIHGEFPSRDVPLTEEQVLDYLFPGDAFDVATSAARKLGVVVARLRQHAAK